MNFKSFLNRRSLAFSLGILIFMIGLGVSGCHPPRNRPPRLIKDSVVFLYPAEARNKMLEGTVVLQVFVDEKGNVTRAEVYKSSGYDVLDEAALQVAKGAKFKPAIVNGKVAAVWVTWPMMFKISPMMFSVDEWKRKAIEYQFEASSPDRRQRKIGQQSLYFHYKDLANYIAENRFLYPNQAILDVVDPAVRKQWLKYQDVWPLAFVLFHDYTYRYPDSEFYDEAMDYLAEYIRSDIFHLKNMTNSTILSEKTRKELLEQMKKFLKEYCGETVK